MHTYIHTYIYIYRDESFVELIMELIIVDITLLRDFVDMSLLVELKHFASKLLLSLMETR